MTAPSDRPLSVQSAPAGWVRRNKRAFGYDGQRWCAYWWFVGWDCISLGLSVCTKPNIEIHLPFGFFRVGRV